VKLSHIDERGRARMVDVSDKDVTRRVAIAAGRVAMAPQTVALIRDDQIAKGDVFAVARVAAILAAKQTAQLIPMCHPLPLTDVQVDLELEGAAVQIRARVTTLARTGAEMEALTAVAVAALTIYDMCKAVDPGMALEGIRLIHKEGGKSDWPDAAAPSDEDEDRGA